MLRVRGDALAGDLDRDLRAVGVLLPEDRAVGEELAADLDRGIDEAAGIVADVHDQLVEAGVQVGLQRPS